MKDIHGLAGDVRLLVVLDVLLEEGNATRAAARLGVTQSSVSHSLRRLRTALGDELLVRSGRRLVLTPRAEELREPLRELLEQLGALVRGRAHFAPETSTRSVVVMASDLFTSSVLPRLMRQLLRRAPGMSISIRAPRPDVFGALEQGGVDLLFGAPPNPPRGIRRRLLFRDDFTCLIRRDHPRVRRRLDLDAYLEERHVLVTPTSKLGSVLDDRLSQLGRRRDIALTLPHFAAAGQVVAETELVTTMPTRTALPLARTLGLRRFAPPLPDLGYEIRAYWHVRVAHDPAVMWLLEVVTASLGKRS